MEIHILNGDALTDRMLSAGFSSWIVARECLIEGPVKAVSIENFWENRADYIAGTFNEDRKKYYNGVVAEFEKLKTVSKGTPIYLWFEDDLFCQANMWFTISYLDSLGLTGNLYRVFPILLPETDRWSGFGPLSPEDLKTSWKNSIAFTPAEVTLGTQLWSAYSLNDHNTLKSLSATSTRCFRDLPAVIQAHIDRFAQPGRPQKVLQEIINSGHSGFGAIFSEFYKRGGGIYGFGDVQVKNILMNMQ